MSAAAVAFQRTRPGSLLDTFQAFWTEVLRERTLAEAVAPTLSGEATARSLPPGVSTSIPGRDRLAEMLRRCSRAAMRDTRSPRYGDGVSEVQYLMAALADEVFLTLEWQGKAAWRNWLLETEFFRSRDAGETVFERIDRLLLKEDPADKELAAVYLAALALGFRGRYLGVDDGGVIDNRKRDLATFIAGRVPQINAAWRMAPDCYAATVHAGSGRKLRDARLWALATVAVFAVWLAASTFLWNRISGDVKAGAEQALQSSSGAAVPQRK